MDGLTAYADDEFQNIKLMEVSNFRHPHTSKVFGIMKRQINFFSDMIKITGSFEIEILSHSMK